VASGDFQELSQRAARAARFDPSNATDLLRANEAVNQAYLTACAGGQQFDFLEQEGQWSCTASSDVYTYASIATAMSVSGATIGEVLTIVDDTDGMVLESMDWQSLEKLAYSTKDSDPTSRPIYWAKWGSRIRLYPSPDEVRTYGVIVRLVPAEMSATTDTPLIPIQHRHAVIVPHAAANLLRQEGGSEAHQEALYYQRLYDDAWTAMRTAHATARQPTFRLKSPGWDQDFSSFTRPNPLWPR
jgi:hypothetical protein